MASLFVVRGRDQGKHFQLSESVYRIGREAGSDIQLIDTETSRSHAEIRMHANGTWDVQDLDSSNGTVVNGKSIRQHALANGDRIEIGSTLLIFTGTGQPNTMEAAHGVDIVTKGPDDSRIVSSLLQSGSEVIAPHGVAGPSEADRSLEVMYLTAIAVGRTGDLDQVLDRVLNLVFDWVEADRGCIMLRDTESGELQPAARCDREQSQDLMRDQQIAISRTILEYVIGQKEGVRTSNAGDDSRFNAAVSIVQAGVREALCVPLQGRFGIVGAMYVDTYTAPGELVSKGGHERFTDDHLRLITAIGHQAALAIEDTFYYSALVQSERLAAMGQTIATLSHHVKNILQGIRGGSYLIEAGLDRDDTNAVRRGWGIVDKNQERISNLVMDMLTFSKERVPELVEADLNETVADVVELMGSRAAQQDVQLGSDLDPSLPPASFDPDAIHRAVLNLVTNAIDAASGELTGEDDFDTEEEQDAGPSDPPKVFVQTRFDSETGWTIDVVDNGPGIAAEDREKIFSPFESSKGMRGTGLGLPVCAKIMREHRGEIQYVDPGFEHGTCFRLRLPPTGTSGTDAATGETIS
jgi:signal transduction histidine kinase/pSer/pThr/pTyr-binding forkhead associated (FHA) protein